MELSSFLCNNEQRRGEIISSDNSIQQRTLFHQLYFIVLTGVFLLSTSNMRATSVSAALLMREAKTSIVAKILQFLVTW